MAEQAPSADCAREPAAAEAADPSSHQHSSHKHSSHKSSEKEILSELLSIADIPVASHKSSSSSHHHSRRHAAPATVVDPMHLKTASQHLKAARHQQIVDSDASDSATGSSPPKQKIRNRVAASTNANATLDSFLTTSGDNSQSGNLADGENSTSVGDNGVTNVSGVEDMMFPSYSDHAKPDHVAEAVADVAGLTIKDETNSAVNVNDAPKVDTSEKSEMRKSNSVSALENADKKPQSRGSVNVETSEVLAAMRVWGANRGAANAAGNADSAFMQPYQGSSYSSYVDDHRTSPRVSSDAPAREEPAKLERSRSKSYPELAELAKSTAVPKIKPLGGMRSGEKSEGKAAVMDKLGVGQEDSEYADTEYFGWLLSGGSKFAKPASTRQDPEDQCQETATPNSIQSGEISLAGVEEASKDDPSRPTSAVTCTEFRLKPGTEIRNGTHCQPPSASSTRGLDSGAQNSTGSGSSSNGEVHSGKGNPILFQKSGSKAFLREKGNGWFSSPLSKLKREGRRSISGSSSTIPQSSTFVEGNHTEAAKRRSSLDETDRLREEVCAGNVVTACPAADAAVAVVVAGVEAEVERGADVSMRPDSVRKEETETSEHVVSSKRGIAWWGLIRRKLTAL